MFVRNSGKNISFIMAVLGVLWASMAGAQGLTGLFSEDQGSRDKIVTIRAEWSADSARPGDRVILAVVMDLKKGYHINANAAQIKPIENFKPYPTTIKAVEASREMIVETVYYPKAHPVKLGFAPEDIMTFSDRVVAYLPVKFLEPMTSGRVKMKIEVDYQACNDSQCFFPEQVLLAESIPTAVDGQPPQNINASLFESYRELIDKKAADQVRFDMFGWNFSLDASSILGWGLLLVTAAFGGFLLNFTPCVLPLIPIKMMSLSNVAENRRKCVSLGSFTFLGIFSFWIVLGAAIILVGGFTATSQLFQYPAFTIIIGIILVVMSAGMIDIFTIKPPAFVYRIRPSQNTHTGSFGVGVLTAILSTPCTAPFMGAAAAWAVTRNPATTLSTFAAIGTGMALPYLILSIFPGLIKNVPKTGPASVLIKQVMGLFMLAAASYFIGTGLSAFFASPSTPPSRAYWWAVMLFCAAGGAWVAFRAYRIEMKKKWRFFLTVLGVFLIIGSGAAGNHLTAKESVNWIYYTPDRFDLALRQKKIVVMDFSAEWCLNCKALEEGVLNTRIVSRLLNSRDVAPIKVDITGHNPDGRKLLKKIGHLTIPLLVIYDPNGQEVFRSDFYTIEQVLGAVEKIRNNTS